MHRKVRNIPKSIRKGEHRPTAAFSRRRDQVSLAEPLGRNQDDPGEMSGYLGATEGARIEWRTAAIDSRTNVYLRMAPVHGLMGNATVRYCRRSGMKHIVGLQFSSAASEADQGRRRLIQHPPSAEK